MTLTTPTGGSLSSERDRVELTVISYSSFVYSMPLWIYSSYELTKFKVRNLTRPGTILHHRIIEVTLSERRDPMHICFQDNARALHRQFALQRLKLYVPYEIRCSSFTTFCLYPLEHWYGQIDARQVVFGLRYLFDTNVCHTCINLLLLIRLICHFTRLSVSETTAALPATTANSPMVSRTGMYFIGKSNRGLLLLLWVFFEPWMDYGFP